MSKNRRERSEAVKHAEQKSTNVLWGGMLLGGIIALAYFVAPNFSDSSKETVTPVSVDTNATTRPLQPETVAAAPDSPQETAPSHAPKIERLKAKVLKRYPHERDAFTQGLLWHDGMLYESTGQYGRSSLRKVQVRSGKVIDKRDLDKRMFGEGLARIGDRLVQLTWHSRVALFWEINTLEQTKSVPFDSEGWGACFDGEFLVTTDGTATLSFRDPESMRVVRSVRVRHGNRMVYKLNELECVGNAIYANVWQSDEIVRIDAESGAVTAIIDASGLLTPEQRRGTDVLNGIAYVPKRKTFLLTGKLWPHVFEVKFIEN